MNDGRKTWGRKWQVSLYFQCKISTYFCQKSLFSSWNLKLFFYPCITFFTIIYNYRYFDTVILQTHQVVKIWRESTFIINQNNENKWWYKFVLFTMKTLIPLPSWAPNSTLSGFLVHSRLDTLNSSAKSVEKISCGMFRFVLDLQVLPSSGFLCMCNLLWCAAIYGEVHSACILHTLSLALQNRTKTVIISYQF